MRSILIFLATISFELTSLGMPGPIVYLTGRSVYEQQMEISKAFLDHSEQCVKDDDKFWNIFCNQYERKRHSLLNITKLSSRARIHLFKKIILHKISHQWNPEYWDKQSGEDKYPTEFQVGNMIFQVISKFSKGQPGNIIIRSCHLHDECYEAKTWENIFNKISSIPENILRDDSRYKQLKTEFYFMLDFEVARRLVDGDRYADLPIITYVHYLREHYRECKDFIVGRKVQKMCRRPTNHSLFAGVQREKVARILTEKISFTSPQSIRRSLDCLCGDDERSDYEYTQ